MKTTLKYVQFTLLSYKLSAIIFFSFYFCILQDQPTAYNYKIQQH